MRTLAILGGGLNQRTTGRLAAALGLLAVALVTAAASQGAAPARTHARLALVHAPRSNGSVSLNWAGYVARGTTFSDVAATWTEPRVECAPARALDASSFWIGLGGASFSSPGLEQTGTAADCVHGQPRYYAWYEVLPAPAVELALSIRPGDTIAADVNVAGTVVTFTLRNLATGGTFTRQLPVRFPALDSAEWIAEAPSLCRSSGDCETLPLARFHSVLFTGAAATAGDLPGSIADARWSVDAIRLASKSGPVSAEPSGLSPDGSSFSVATHGPRAPTLFAGAHTRLPLRVLHLAGR